MAIAAHVQVIWCVKCEVAVMWSLMADAESPKTLFELLYAWLPADVTARVMYDNACNALQYILNREPELGRRLEFYIDAMHFKGHKGCCESYNSGDSHRLSDPLFSDAFLS